MPDAPDPVLPNSNQNRSNNNNSNNLLLPPAPTPATSSSMTTISSVSKRNINTRPRSASSSSFASNKNSNTQQSKSQKPQQVAPAPTERELRIERMRLREKMLYNDSIECPICFLVSYLFITLNRDMEEKKKEEKLTCLSFYFQLFFFSIQYYPSNINYSRCCDQPLCTECFVQIKRPPESQTTPATCPFCMQDNFGIIYKPPSWSESLRVNKLLQKRKQTTVHI